MHLKHRFLDIYELIRKSFLHLTYPSKCLHCFTLLPPQSAVLCSTCSLLLEMIDPQERCPTCFNVLASDFSLPCQECLQYPSCYHSLAASFDYQGPAATLVKRLKYSNQPYLAKGMAAFLITQWDRLGWPIPDAFIPVPLSFTHWLERGYNQSALLAEEMGCLLKRPVWNALKRKSGDFSQAALTLEQRKSLDGKSFQLNTNYSLENKILIVIDDVMTSGSTLRRCAEVLQQSHPACMYALTFCRTLA